MSKELIKISTNEQGKKLVSARELHKGLEIKTPFHKWMPRMIEYGFEENIDFRVEDIFVPNSNGGKQTQKDYAITLDMAKEISMIQRSELGKKFRQYFIECEKKLIEVSRKANLLEAIYNGGQEGVLASKQLVELETKPLLDKIEEDKPLVNFANTIASSSDNIDIGQFAKVIKDEGIKMGRNKLFDWLRKNNYLRKNNEPYQKYIDDKTFELIEVSKITPYGNKIFLKTLITGKGQIKILEKLSKEYK
ncbi:MAG: antA/AntB antirepressor family protein [Clostridioides difficile]|nr:antA/AntB antirepressor family protein [Clostridioides difficile]